MNKFTFYIICKVIITGSSRDESTTRLLRYVRSKFMPNKSLIFIDPDVPPTRLGEHNEVIRSLLDSLSAKTLELPEVRICEGGVCGLPLRGVELESVLR